MNKKKPMDEGKTETKERKIIPDFGKKGQTEPPERVIKHPQKLQKEK
jgi:hypothetical protein